MKYKVLIVDDEPGLREVLKEDLSESFEVLVAKSGNKALALLQENQVDIIVSDIRMPDGDGVELLKTVRALWPNGPKVILMTGYSDLTKSEVLSLGGSDLLNKVTDIFNLNQIIQEHLN